MLVVVADSSPLLYLVLIDDLDGRRVAQGRGIPVTGTQGVLDRAAGRGLVDILRALDDLQRTTMHLSQSLVESLLKRHIGMDDRGRCSQ